MCIFNFSLISIRHIIGTSFWEGVDNPEIEDKSRTNRGHIPIDKIKRIKTFFSFIHQDATIEGVFSLLCVTIVPYNTYNKPPQKSYFRKVFG